MTETASTADLPFNVTRKRRSSANGGPSSSAPRASSSRAQARLGFAANDQAMTEARAGSSPSAQSPGAWASWAQAGLRFAASDKAMIEARARILDSHSAASSSRYAVRCGEYHVQDCVTYLTSRRALSTTQNPLSTHARLYSDLGVKQERCC